MKRGKWILYIMSAVFLAVIVLCGQLDPLPQMPPVEDGCGLSLRVMSGEGDIEISLWKTPAGEYSAFLPGHSRLEETTFEVDPGYTVFLDGQPVQNGTSCSFLRSGVGYTLTWKDAHGDSKTSVLTFYAESTLPAVYLDVRSGSMDYIHSAKGAEESGTIQIYLPDGSLHYNGSLESVKGRGNATWDDKEKKPYNIKLRTQADLLEMGQAQQWVLLANVYDDSHIRNKIVYETAERLGLAYSPQCRWVELYLNGEYAGLYLLCEKNEIHASRVAIDSVKGNLISIEKEDRLWEYDQHFVTEGGTPIRVRETTDGKKLQEAVHCLERAILAEDGVDPVTGKQWLDLIDLESWVKKYLIEEAFGNLDAGSISQFFYWEDGGKIFAGPVWDYDVSMGSAGHWQLQDVNMLHAGRPHLWSAEDTPWYYALSQKPEFQAELERTYGEQLRPLLQLLTADTTAQYAQEIAEGARRNQIRWGCREAGQETERVLSYLTQRMDFLDSLWLEKNQFHLVQLHMNWVVMGCYAVAPGETVPEQPVPGNWGSTEYVGWYDAATEEPYDFSKPVTQDLFLYMKEMEHGQEVTQSAGGLSGKIWLIPMTALAVLFGALTVVELLRNKVNGSKQEQRRKAAKEAL